MTNSPATRTTSAFYLQSIIAFATALGVVVIGEIYLPVPTWTRAFLAIGTVFLVSATFTLAKCVRDQQETETVVSRIDRARIERMLAEYDPYRVQDAPQGANHHQPTPAEHYPSYPAPSGVHV